MATKKREGNVTDVTVAILRNIRDELKDLRSIRDELRELRVEVHELRVDTNERFEALESTTARGFEAVTARIEHLRDFSGERWRDHERRIRRLEARSSH
jgi:hypothetical protein